MGGMNSLVRDDAQFDSWSGTNNASGDTTPVVTEVTPGNYTAAESGGTSNNGAANPPDSPGNATGSASNSPQANGIGQGRTATDPLGSSRNPFVNIYEAWRKPIKPYTYTFKTGAQTTIDPYKKHGTMMIESYETSTSSSNEQQKGKPTSTQGIQPLGSYPPPELGESVKPFESGKEGVSSVSPGVNDPGGVSFGSYQLSLNSGTLNSFLKSPEGSPFSPQFKGMAPGSEDFIKKRKEIASNNPDEFHSAEKNFIYRTHYLPLEQYAAKKAFDMNHPGLQDAVWSGSIQHGKFKRVLDAASKDPLFNYASPEDQIKSIYSARSNYTDSLPGVPPDAGRLRYEKELPTLLGYHKGKELFDTATKEHFGYSIPETLPRSIYRSKLDPNVTPPIFDTYEQWRRNK